MSEFSPEFKEKVCSFFMENLNIDISDYSDDRTLKLSENLNKILDEELIKEKRKTLELEQQLLEKKKLHYTLLEELNN